MKRYFILILTLLLALSAFPVSAQSPKIVDDASLLTADQIADLSKRAENIANTYQMDLVIVTVDSLGGKSAQAFADDYYDDHSYGMGNDYSGTVLLLSMEYRDWAVSTCGEAIYAFTDNAISSAAQNFLPWLGNGNYYMGFLTFLEAAEKCYEAYRCGDPLDQHPGDYNGPGFIQNPAGDDIIYNKQEPGFMFRFLIGLVAGAAAGGIALLIMRSKMNTAKQQSGAGSYMKENSFDLFRCHDLFLYSRTTKTRRSSDSGGSRGGGSSIHRSSSGRSHGGRSGKF